MSSLVRFAQNGDLNVRGEIIQTPKELWGTGGRNLVPQSDYIKPNSNNSVVNFSWVEDMGMKNVLKLETKSTDFSYITAFYQDMTTQAKIGEKLSVTLYMRGIPYPGEPNTMHMYYNSGTSQEVFRDIPSTEYKEVSVTYDVNSDDARFHLYPRNFKELYIAKVKIELGDQPTPWSPAPEDIGAGWIPNWVQNFSHPILHSPEGDMAFNREFYEVPRELRGTGGRNLLSGGAEEKGKDISQPQAEHLYYADIYKILDENLNEEITISFDVKAEVGHYLQVYCSNRTDDRTFDAYTFRDFGTEKQRLSFTTTAKVGGRGNGRKEAYLEFYGQYDTGNIFKISNVKIEKGDKATPYSPSPEEIGIDYLPKTLHQFSTPLIVHDDFVAIGGEGSEVKDAIVISSYNSNLTVENPLYYQQPTEQEWTVEAMVLLDDRIETSIQYLIYGLNHGIRLEHGATTKPLFYLNSGTNDSYVYGKTSLKDGKWHHIAFSYRYSDRHKMYYLDGVVDNGSEASRGEQIPAGMEKTLKIGEDMFGQIQYVRLWNKALTQEEILNIRGKKHLMDERTVGLWVFDESSGGIRNEVTGEFGTFNGTYTWASTLDYDGGAV